MQIVIDIPDRMWERVKEGYVPLGISKHLKKGIPLPKGHGRLIDADRFINDFACHGHIDDMGVGYFRTVTPTIIEADKEDGDEEDKDSN